VGGGSVPESTTGWRGPEPPGPAGGPRPGRREGEHRRLPGSSRILRSEQLEKAELATVVVGAGRPGRDLHDLRRLLDAHLVEEHEVEPLALAGRERAERPADVCAALAGSDDLVGLGTGRARVERAPGEPCLEPVSSVCTA